MLQTYPAKIGLAILLSRMATINIRVSNPRLLQSKRGKMKKIDDMESKTIAFQGMAGAYSDLACAGRRIPSFPH
jgi:hypothetical protein